MILKLVIVTGLLFLSGAALMALTHIFRQPGRAQVKKDWIKFGVYLAIVPALLLLGYYGRFFIAIVLIAIATAGAIELHVNLRSHNPRPGTISNAFFMILILSLGHLLFENHGDWYSKFAFIFLVVSATDSFSQLSGRLLGKHKLCPGLSPGKTAEGLLGGLISALVISWLLSFLLPGLATTKILAMGSIIAVSAIIGDLIFSHIKRKIGIKDFSGILPGHGGILDRFDSLITAAPISYWAWLLIIR